MFCRWFWMVQLLTSKTSVWYNGTDPLNTTYSYLTTLLTNKSFILTYMDYTISKFMESQWAIFKRECFKSTCRYHLLCLYSIWSYSLAEDLQDEACDLNHSVHSRVCCPPNGDQNYKRCTCSPSSSLICTFLRPRQKLSWKRGL